MTKKQQGNIALIILLIAAIAFAVWWLAKSGYKLPREAVEEEAPAIQDTSGLDTATEDLDSTDLNEMDSDLNQIDSDSSSF